MRQRIGTLFNFIGGLSGLISLLTVALVVGEVRRQVSVNARRLDIIEAAGSPGLKAHEAMDDIRNRDQDREISELKAGVQELRDMRSELRVINTKLDRLQLDFNSAKGKQ